MKTSSQKENTVIVQLTKAQYRYLEELGYFLRATPAELLTAGCFAHVEVGMDFKADAWGRDLLNFVVEKRVPESGCDIFHVMDSGQFTEPELEERRHRLLDLPDSEEKACTPTR
jgi:hypothetical protein